MERGIDMRKCLAILLCKVGSFLGGLMGKGSTLPGKLALMLCPDILRQVEVPEHIIAVTGSNGKTSTVELIAAILRGAGNTVVLNEKGANQLEGVATSVLTHADLQGRVVADILLLECDERSTAQIFRYFPPKQLVITNLFRDQLTRNGHPEWIYDAILSAIPPEVELILNADDPLSSCFSRGHEKVSWFGLERSAASSKQPTGVYHDGACCPICKGPMEYDYVHYNHIGAYRCKRCGHHKPKTDYNGTSLDLETGELVIDHWVSILLDFCSIYHAYNILAAYAVSRQNGVSPEQAAEVVNQYALQSGRTQSFTLGEHHGTLLTSKHENSISYDTNLRYIAGTKRDCVVLIIVDSVSRKYFTCETSWLWDIDFAQLKAPHVKQIILSGRYANDLAERFSFTELENWSVQPSIFAAAQALEDGGKEELYVVTCFSDRDKLLDHVEKEI